MINNHPPFRGLNIGIPIVIPIKGRGFINQGSGLGYKAQYRAGMGLLEKLGLANLHH